MIKAQVATQGEIRSELEVLTNAIEQGTRELLVQSEIMSSHTYYIIGAVIAKPDSEIALGGRAAVSHQVDASLRIHVYQAYLVGDGITAVVDDAYLHATRMRNTNIKQTYLRATERIGIVVASHLQASHRGRADVHQSQLHSSLHTHGNIGDTAELDASERRARHIVEERHLNTIATLHRIRHARDLHTTSIFASRPDDTRQADATQLMANQTGEQAYLHATKGIGLAKQAYISTTIALRPRQLG